jgi:hypothetical protein
VARRQYSDELKAVDFQILDRLYIIVYNKLTEFQSTDSWEKRRKSWAQILAMYIGAYAMDMDVNNMFRWRMQKRRSKLFPNYRRLDLRKWIRIPVYPSVYQLLAHALNVYKFQYGSQDVIRAFIKPHVNMRRVMVDLASQIEYMCEDLLDDINVCGVETEGNIFAQIKDMQTPIEVLVHWGYFDKHPIIVPRITSYVRTAGSIIMANRAKKIPHIAQNLKKVITQIRRVHVERRT